MLGAQGANIGTRFLANAEAAAAASWQQAILAAESEDAIRFEVWKEIVAPASSLAYDTVPRVLPTPFVAAWRQRPNDARREAERLRGEIMTAIREGRTHELAPFTRQTAGLIHDIRPAGEMVTAIIAEAERALTAATGLIA